MGDVKLPLRSTMYDTMDDAKVGDLYCVNSSEGNFMFVAVFLGHDVSRDRNTALSICGDGGCRISSNLSGQYSNILSRVDASDG